MDDLSLLFESMRGIQGATALFSAAFATQLLKKIADQFFGDKFDPFWQIALVYAASILFGVVFLHIQGVDLKAALLHANTLAQAQVFGHQVYKQTKGKLNG